MNPTKRENFSPRLEKKVEFILRKNSITRLVGNLRCYFKVIGNLDERVVP